MGMQVITNQGRKSATKQNVEQNIMAFGGVGMKLIKVIIELLNLRSDLTSGLQNVTTASESEAT